MAQPRTLRITVEVTDEGGETDYEDLLKGFAALGAEVISEEEV